MKVTDEQICVALLGSSTVEEAADYLGVSVSTIYKREQTEQFKALYKDMNYKLLQAATEKIRTTMLSAIQIAKEIAEDEENAPQIRLNACDLLLRHAIKLSSYDFANEEHERKWREAVNATAGKIIKKQL